MKALEWLKKIPPGKPARETAGSSQTSQVTRAGVKESAAATSPGPMRVMGHLREAAAAPADGAGGVGAEAPGRRFRVVLLQEGMGNLEDCYYYTREAIESCPPLFEGKKLFVDHPDAMEEQTRPERSVRDVAGWFENLGVENAQDGRAMLVGDAVLLESPDVDSIKALMLESIAYSKTHAGADLVGLSISAGGDFETVSLEQFSRTEEIPEGCQAKLAEASAKGISMIRPVRRMTSATSCDLVTEAGAGGRISQLLERERKNMAAKVAATKVKESEKKEESKEAKEDGSAAPAKDGSSDGKAGGSKKHDDADADKELIKKELAKHVGDGFDESDHKMYSEAYEAAMEAHGGDEKEARETAGRVMRMAKHAQSKQKKQAEADAAGAEAKEAEGPTSETQEAGSDAGQKTRGMVPGPSSASNGAAPGPNTTVESAETKESAQVVSGKLKEAEAKVLTLTAENVALKAKIEERELSDFIDSKLRESHLPNTATKKFRECIKGIKTQKEVTEKLELFREAYAHGTGEAGDGSGLFVMPEKATTEAAEGPISFADCVDA